MPAIPLRRDQPTAYLDASHLNAAYNAIEGRLSDRDLDAGHALVRLIGEVARDANLVLSCFHLVEFAQFVPPDGADNPTRGYLDRQCSWLESLDHVFVRASTALEAHEWRNLLLRLAGADHLAVEPFTASIVIAFGERWAPTDLADALQEGSTINAVVDQLTRRQGERPERDFMLDSIRALQEDRAQVHEDGRSGELRGVLAAKHERGLLETVCHTHAALVEEGHEGYLRGLASLTSLRAILNPAEEVQERALAVWREAPGELRLFDLRRRFFRGLEDATTQTVAASRRARERYESSTFDLAHAQAGAHCDIFTCDRHFARLTAGARESWGRKPAISGSLSAVVVELGVQYRCALNASAACQEREG
ncbi:MAG: hypothetical protein H6721_24100 [Sandaracinus sp.]|nr:hypothetical protein [Sandaracinus sp.]MCB9635216.1 hypothetical protein [Sandaracinus sp.]